MRERRRLLLLLLALQARDAYASLAARGPPAGGGKRVWHAEDIRWAHKAAADEGAGGAAKRRRGRSRSSKRQAQYARLRGYSEHFSHLLTLRPRTPRSRFITLRTRADGCGQHQRLETSQLRRRRPSRSLIHVRLTSRCGSVRSS